MTRHRRIIERALLAVAILGAVMVLGAVGDMEHSREITYGMGRIFAGWALCGAGLLGLHWARR